MPDPNLIRFRALVAGALAHLESRREEVNDLNVFPVADGDTGDNMVLTMQAVLDELDRLAAGGDRTIDEIGRDEIVESVARAALLGARGNSGVILSQLIHGAAEELFSFRNRVYGFVAIRLDQYACYARPISPRWDTWAMPVKRFRQLARPLSSLL